MASWSAILPKAFAAGPRPRYLTLSAIDFCHSERRWLWEEHLAPLQKRSCWTQSARHMKSFANEALRVPPVIHRWKDKTE